MKSLALVPIIGLTSMANYNEAQAEFNQPFYDRMGAYEHYLNELSYTSNPFQVNQYIAQKDKSVLIIDLRDKHSYASGHVPGSINLPLEEWNNTVMLDKKKTIIIYCYSITCNLAKRAALKLIKDGYEAKEMIGGWQSWLDNKYPVEKK